MYPTGDPAPAKPGAVKKKDRPHHSPSLFSIPAFYADINGNIVQ